MLLDEQPRAKLAFSAKVRQRTTLKRVQAALTAVSLCRYADDNRDVPHGPTEAKTSVYFPRNKTQRSRHSSVPKLAVSYKQMLEEDKASSAGEEAPKPWLDKKH